ncbi:hypothetical protein [Desulfovibrio sp. UCD-KL4C]|uniref:hypothetical protein n=1 Tax=Desulfovibrio sp. UCD-KL4C TaxID=2578120 RepID=UPI0025BB1E1A|nr:hypothetical protein [Desulfovibrio sp. UCD-KL4C]
MYTGSGNSKTLQIGFRGLPQEKIDNLRDELFPSSEHFHKAMFIAIKKTARWAQTVAAKNIKADTGLPSKKIKERMRMFRRGNTMRLYFGLNPIPVSSLNPKQTKKGVSAKGGVNIPGAFIVDNGDGVAVFKRRGSEAYSIEFQRVYFDVEAMRVIQADIEPHLQDKFYEILEHELKWQMTK